MEQRNQCSSPTWSLTAGPVDIFIDAAETITDIGRDIRKRHRGEAEFVIDGNGALALAGLSNTHTHAAMTLLRGYADDMILQDWLDPEDLAARSPPDR